MSARQTAAAWLLAELAGLLILSGIGIWIGWWVAGAAGVMGLGVLGQYLMWRMMGL